MAYNVFNGNMEIDKEVKEMNQKQREELSIRIQKIPDEELNKNIIHLMNKYSRGVCSESTFRNYINLERARRL